MDILGKRVIEITSLAMDGLATRHKAISSNIANANVLIVIFTVPRAIT